MADPIADEDDTDKPAADLAQAIVRFDRVFAQQVIDTAAIADWKMIRAACAPFSKTESPVFLPLAVHCLNSVKAWRDSDGNERFPLETRMQIDALLMAYELRRSQRGDALARLHRSPILKWAVETFGPIALNFRERAARFAEEALELVQVVGLPRDTAQAILDRVYSRAPGDAKKEVGQAQMTLDILAEVLGVDPQEQASREFERIQKVPKEEWAWRHAEKVSIGIANLEPGTNG